MKKLLFTLAALCAFSIAGAYEWSQPAPTMGFMIDGEYVTEITLNPGESQEVDIAIVQMFQPMVSGMQAQWRMYDVNHANINYDVTNKVAPGKVYGSRVKTWFQGIDAGTGDESVGGFPGIGVATAMPYENIYRIMITNTANNMCFFRYDADGNERFNQRIGHFTLIASPDWNEEFATMELDLNYTLFNQCPGLDPNVFEEARTDQPMILKINNGDLITPVVTPDLPGYIIVGTPAANGEFYVNYLSGDYEGAYEVVVTINGEVVEANENGTYQAVEGENNVVVTVKADGYNDKVATNNFNYHYPTTAPAPTFVWDAETFTMEAVCEGHTVVLYANGTEVENPYTAEQTDVEQSIVFSAYTVAADEDNNSAVVYYAENPVIIPALPVVVTPPAAPTYEVTYDDDFMYITFACEEGAELTIYDEYGQEVAENPVKIARPEYDEAADPVYVHYSAKATKDGVDSETVYVNEKVNQKAKPEEVDPHATGWWIVLIDANNEEVWYPLHEGEDGSWVTTVTLNYGDYGTFYWDPDLSAAENNLNRPNVPYYFVVDGQVWGAPEADQATLMGEAANTMSNPLYENENHYTVPVGYSYVLGIYVDPSEDDQLQDGTWYYVYCAQGPQTDARELNAAKAVAGVRYFNLMGQEMQEANGMTIVVTTYTDGTTTATKVVK